MRLSSLGFQGMNLWPPEMCVLIGHFRMGADPEFCFRDADMQGLWPSGSVHY